MTTFYFLITLFFSAESAASSALSKVYQKHMGGACVAFRQHRGFGLQKIFTEAAKLGASVELYMESFRYTEEKNQNFSTAFYRKEMRL